MDDPNLTQQSNQQSPEWDSTGETSLAKLSTEEDRVLTKQCESSVRRTSDFR